MKPFDKAFTHRIQPETEILAICSFLQATWGVESLQRRVPDGKPNAIESLVSEVFMSGYEALPDAFNYLEAYGLLGNLHKNRKKTLSNLGGLGSEFPNGDGLKVAYRGLCEAVSEILMSGSTNSYVTYDKLIRRLLADLKSDYLGCEKLLPKGYEDFTRNYRDYAGMDTLDKGAQESLYEGHSISVKGAPELPVGLSLPHVAYDDLAQGRPPEELLISKIFAQGQKIREYNNTVTLKQELAHFADHESPFSASLIVPNAGQPMLYLLWQQHVSDSVKTFEPLTGEYIQAKLAAKAAFMAKPPVEQARQRRESVKRILNLLQEHES